MQIKYDIITIGAGDQGETLAYTGSSGKRIISLDNQNWGVEAVYGLEFYSTERCWLNSQVIKLQSTLNYIVSSSAIYCATLLRMLREDFEKHESHINNSS